MGDISKLPFFDALFFSRGFTEGLFSLGGVSVKSGRLPRCVCGVASLWEKDVSKLQEE